MLKQQVLQNLEKLVAIESVSTDKKRAVEIRKAVEFIKDQLEKIGFKVNIYSNENSHPLIIAKKIFNKSNQTLGFYAHYDVQPEDPIDLWNTSPFKLVKKNGKFYGRGVADDKGHLILLVEAARELILEETNLKNNLVFIFEGEEEIGSANFEELIKKDKDLKKVDVFYVVDMEVRDKSTSQLFYGLRGICEFELKVKVADYDLHSGVYGNLVYNPVQIIANLLTKIKNDKLKVKIPGFYKDVIKPSKKEISELKKLGPYEAKIYPSFDVNGIISGFTQEGVKTIIPSEAIVKFSIRLVSNQDYKKIEKLVVDFIKKNLPKEIKYEIKTFYGSNPFYTSLDNPFVEKTKLILEDVFKNKTALNRSGGSVPAAEILSRLFKKPVILLGFILPDANLHAPQENFDEEMFWKGYQVVKKILSIK
ncbi:MAG: M20/M25/M40 family metallo-hydrolase [Candidatus Microgenomates bacterium]